MPYCNTCGTRFKGRGSHCTHHSRYKSDAKEREHRNHCSDSNNPRNIRPFTSQRHPVGRFVDEFHTYNGNGRPTDFNRYSSATDYTALSQPLAQAFPALSHHHAISSLTYSISPNGGRSLTASANFEREQCLVCRIWFPDYQKLHYHNSEFPVGCEEHGICLRRDDVQFHGTSERHERCFLRGCPSVYRKEGGWRGAVIEGHVLSSHC